MMALQPQLMGQFNNSAIKVSKVSQWLWHWRRTTNASHSHRKLRDTKFVKDDEEILTIVNQ